MYIFRPIDKSLEGSFKNSFSSYEYGDIISYICDIADCLRSQLRFSILRESIVMQGYMGCIVYFFKKPVGILYWGGVL